MSISKLALRVPGLDASAAENLARLVARGLAPGIFASPGTASLDMLRIEVRPTAAEQGRPDLLARRIVAQIEQALEAT